MWARRSTDNGVSWLSDQTFSDAVSPLPAQPDPGIQATYAGDYDYGSSSPNQHLRAWVDGRVAIGGSSQQDAFHDRQSTSAASPTATPTATATATPTPAGITLSARGYQVQRRNTVDLSWSGAASSTVDIYRNNVLLINTSNDGFYTDSIGNRGHGTYTYKVCEAGTQTCSNDATVNF